MTIVNQKEWFETWFDSPFYHLLYTHRDKEEAKLLVQRLIDYLNPPKGSKVIDMGCGAGRHALELSHHDLDVTGIDLSSNRIQIAKKFETDNLHFYKHDMRIEFRTNYYDYLFNFFTSFGYFSTLRDTKLAAKTFVKALKPGGIMLIDYLNTYISEKNLTESEIINKNGISFDVKRKIENGKFVKDIIVEDQDGHSHKYQEKVATVNLNDFRELFEPLGVSLIDTFGDYQLQPFIKETSPRLIMIFKKN